jgi:glyoxylase-like metal-dependent hydrolase (beta-lactamase superfamily II)
MSRTLLVRVFAGVLFLAFGYVAYTQQKGGPPQLTIEKVKDDLYMIVGDGGNVAVYITNEGTILVDDKYEQDHDQIMEKVKSVTNQPIKYILSTHYHADHSGGNTKMLPMGIEIISTRNAHDGIVQKKQSNAPPGMVPARVTFTDETDVFLGGKEVRAKYYGRGHTNGDAVIYFPALRVVHTGDLFTAATPLIDYPGGGSLVEWTKTLDAVMNALDFDTVIPGHGPVSKKADLLTYRNNAETMRNRAQAIIRQGKSQTEVAKFMTDEYKWAANSLNMQWSLPGMMTELR